MRLSGNVGAAHGTSLTSRARPDLIRAMRSRSILVVDDSATIRSAVGALLEARGCRVTMATTGEEAFALASREPFDVVVTDLTMGLVSGVHLCRLLRGVPALASMPIVMLTATSHPRDRFWAGMAGADAYVEKRSMTQDLGAIIDRVAVPRAEPFVAPVAPGSAFERLAVQMDDLLFTALMSSEINRMGHHLGERGELPANLLALAAEVVDASYLVLGIRGESAVSTNVLARGPWPAVAAPVLRALGVVDLDHAHAVHAPPSGDADVVARSIAAGECVALSIVLGAEAVGELRAYAPRIGARDRQTLELIARESALVLKTMVLAERTRALARTDALTGLANRRAGMERLEHEHELARRNGTRFAIALCDVDHFKSVNDTHGHAIGDEVLKALAGTVRKSIRKVDLAVRWGGEEILVVLSGVGDVGARVVSERIRSGIQHATPIPRGPSQTTISIGIASSPCPTVEQLLERADRALYRAKANGRNRVEVEACDPA